VLHDLFQFVLVQFQKFEVEVGESWNNVVQTGFLVIFILIILADKHIHHFDFKFEVRVTEESNGRVS